MSETTALAKRKKRRGPLVATSEETKELLDPKEDDLTGLFFRRITPIAALIVVAGFCLYLDNVYLAFLTAIGIPAIAGWPMLKQATDMRRRRRHLNRLEELGHLDDVVSEQLALLGRTSERTLRTIAVHDLGYLELRRGNTDRALELLSAVYRKGMKGLLPTASENLSIAYLARGDADAAATWASSEGGPGPRTPHAPAAVHARRDEWDDVLSLDWPESQEQPVKDVRHERRLFFLLRAYARERRGNPDLSLLEGELEAARPAYAGEYDYLTQQWPELRAFVADRCLPPRSAPDAEGLPPARVVEKR